MVGSRFADKYFTRMLLMKILISFQMLIRRDEKLCEKEKGRRRNSFFKAFSLPSFISWRNRYQNVKRWSKKVKIILRKDRR